MKLYSCFNTFSSLSFWCKHFFMVIQDQTSVDWEKWKAFGRWVKNNSNCSTSSWKNAWNINGLMGTGTEDQLRHKYHTSWLNIISLLSDSQCHNMYFVWFLTLIQIIHGEINQINCSLTKSALLYNVSVGFPSIHAPSIDVSVSWDILLLFWCRLKTFVLLRNVMV